MAKILTRLENETFYTALEHYMRLIDREMVVCAKAILSAGTIPKVVDMVRKMETSTRDIGQWQTQR